MEVNEISIDKIFPYDLNAKKHPKNQIEKIIKSIQEFGWGQPITVDKNNVIIVGHGRYLASKEMGLTEVPVLKLDIYRGPSKGLSFSR